MDTLPPTGMVTDCRTRDTDISVPKRSLSGVDEFFRLYQIQKRAVNQIMIYCSFVIPNVRIENLSLPISCRKESLYFIELIECFQGCQIIDIDSDDLLSDTCEEGIVELEKT